MIIAVVKEHEMQIGSPTDVKHVAHIGWDGLTGNVSPSWMNDIRASSELLSLGNFAPSAGTSWASQDFDQPRGSSSFATPSENASLQQGTAAPPDIPRPPAQRKTRRRRRSTSDCPVPSSSSSSRPSDSAMAPASAASDANATQDPNCKSAA
ncbi:CRIB domain-containing protein RIC10-like isoform X2 [Oryza brachyantha]|uniref:CRIB domain-containing protein RIC10-like isoform X2 n=1 Tax=Oryza brachyantha TaxID=4533 RepID=UPI0007765297|nr:CRIB domain-containing protein RIC10-like isoform X2 [Oryza brachyantha]